MAGIEGNEEMNVLKGLVNSLAQSVQTLTARQSAPTDQLKKSVELNSELEYQQRCIKRERPLISTALALIYRIRTFHEYFKMMVGVYLYRGRIGDYNLIHSVHVVGYYVKRLHNLFPPHCSTLDYASLMLLMPLL